MVKPRIVIVDPAGQGGPAVATLLGHRRWTTTTMSADAIHQLPDDTRILFAVESATGDGMAVLREACRNQHPAARLLLCTPQVATRVVARGGPAHQVVALPATPDKVLSAVKRSLRVHDLLGDPAVTSVAASLARVPALPATWTRLNDLLQSDTATMQDAATIVERDPGLAAKVLQLVNSGMLSADRPIGSLLAALQRLGLSMVRDLVLATELFGPADDPALAPAFGPGPLSATSYLVACTARLVAPRAAVHTAFTSGLFHQLGRLAYAMHARDRFRTVLDRCAEGMSISAAEQEVFGLDSRTFAAWMLASWGLPHEVVEAVRWSDDPTRASGRGAPLALSVYLGSRLVREAWHRVVDDEDVRLVSRAELSPWGMAESLEAWRLEADALVARHQAADDAARSVAAS